jgi:dTDP-4-dehydrorhamnose 3,5-epimerase
MLRKSDQISELLHSELAPFVDNRGSFTRLCDVREIASMNIDFKIENVNLSINPKQHTLRGFHYSEGLPAEHKLFVCIKGSIINFTIDTRIDSPSFGKVEKSKLSESSNATLFVPGGCANAWMTLEDDTRVLYLVGSQYDASRERGLRFDDPFFNIPWPTSPSVISSKDLSWKPFRPDRPIT